MFDLFAMGTQVNPSGPDDVGVSPKDTTGPAPRDSPPVEPAPGTERLLPAESRPRTSVDSLASKLSTQHIRHEDVASPISSATTAATAIAAEAMIITAEAIAAETPAAPLPHELPLPQSPVLFVADPAPVPPCPELEMGQRLSSTSSSDEPEPASEPISPSPAPIVVDEIALSHSPPPLDPPRPSRYPNLCPSYHGPSMPKSIESLVEGMISSGDQCNVYQPPPLPLAIPNYIEPDDNVAGMDLEVDESEFYEASVLLDSMPSLRRASGPGFGGIRKHGLLRFRTSSDIALSCANVVRSKPRMRRRRKVLPSVASSAPSAPASPSPSLSLPATSYPD